jgi:lysophospholipase L1-like esterase
MRYVLCVFLLAVSAVLSAADSTPLPVEFFRHLRAGQAQTLVVYGTSLTEYGPWVKELQAWFASHYPKTKVINSGGSGQNSVWGLANVKAKVVDQHPDLVFIEFAINDAHTKFKLTPEQGASNLTAIVTAIKQANPHVEFVLQTMNAALDAPPKTAATDRPKLADFYANYTHFAAANHLPLIDHYPAWSALAQKDPKTFLSYAPDGLHPNAAGIKAVTWPTIERLLAAAEAASLKR